MKKIYFNCFLLLTILAACTMPVSNVDLVPSEGTRAWIDLPREGDSYTLGETVLIRWHASAAEGIQQVEIRINGQIFRVVTEFDHITPLITQSHSWTPSESGQYLIEVAAVSNLDVGSQPSVNKISVLASTSALIPTPIRTPSYTSIPTSTRMPTSIVTNTPIPTSTRMPTSTATNTPIPTSTRMPTSTGTNTPWPEAVIHFWAEPASIQAGKCTNIRWNVTNAQKAVFGGIEQPLVGSYQDCLCNSQRYTLRVTHLDGSVETRTVDVIVYGSCVTPTVDKFGPPKPIVIDPKDNKLVPCPPKEVTLQWQAPSDPSGIASYWVILYSGSTVIRSWPTITNTSLKVKYPDVDCGKTYIWKVSAIDGAGNLGAYELSQFQMMLD